MKKIKFFYWRKVKFFIGSALFFPLDQLIINYWLLLGYFFKKVQEKMVTKKKLTEMTDKEKEEITVQVNLESKTMKVLLENEEILQFQVDNWEQLKPKRNSKQNWVKFSGKSIKEEKGDNKKVKTVSFFLKF